MEKRYAHDIQKRRHQYIRRLEKGHTWRLETHKEGAHTERGHSTESLEETRRGDYTEMGLHGEGRGTHTETEKTRRGDYTEWRKR